MKIEYKNFIGIYKDVYPAGYCQHMIDQFELQHAGGSGSNRVQSENSPGHVKNDYHIHINLRGHDLDPFNSTGSADIFFTGLQQCFNEYTEKFSVLRDDKIRGTTLKMQRTSPGGGYHVWHGEQGNGYSANRVLVYMLYLNTLEPECAGETEFLYQQERYQPVENTMLVWPAAFTHTHRGNTVFGEKSKYIITGWFYYD